MSVKISITYTELSAAGFSAAAIEIIKQELKGTPFNPTETGLTFDWDRKIELSCRKDAKMRFFIAAACWKGLLPQFSHSYENLEGQDLNHLVFSTGDFTFANLKGAQICHGRFLKGDFDNADMSDVVATHTQFDKSSFNTTNLDHSNFFRCSLQQAYLYSASLRKANLTYAYLADADFSLADLCGADLTGSTLTDANFKFTKYNANTKWPEDFDVNNHGFLIKTNKYL